MRKRDLIAAAAAEGVCVDKLHRDWITHLHARVCLCADRLAEQARQLCADERAPLRLHVTRLDQLAAQISAAGRRRAERRWARR